jgi:UDP-glucuronate 4-epimerase
MKILVTGSAGFIGAHLAKKLIDKGDEVVGLDAITDYYDVNIKYNSLREVGVDKEDIKENQMTQSRLYPNYRFIKMKLEDTAGIAALFSAEKFDYVCHLAAQAGVRYSLVNPAAYIQSNIVGFGNVLEGCRHTDVRHLVYASSSSVYGLNETMPFSASDNVDHPVSIYAASKKSNELMAHTYSHLYGLPTTGLRFFTVYGPGGRPDMALYLFTKSIIEGEPIQVFNHGKMVRDFTYVEDIVEGVVRVMDQPAAGNPAWSGKTPDPASSKAPYRIYNIGNNNPVMLMDFIEAIEEAVGKKSNKIMMPIQPGDVPGTYADTTPLVRDFGYQPKTDIRTGVKKFVEWYLAMN